MTTAANEFRRIRYIRPTEAAVPVTLHDGTTGYALTRPAVEGVALRRPRRDGSSARMRLALTGTGWVLVDASTGERLRATDEHGRRVSWPVLASLEELRLIRTYLTAGDRTAAVAALQAHRAARTLKRQRAIVENEQRATDEAASFGLRPWHEASPFEQQAQKNLLQALAGRCLRDWRTVVLVGSTLVEFSHYLDLLRDQPGTLATMDIISAVGFRKSEKALDTIS